MTGIAALLATTLLIADCVSVDRCLLARSIVRYSQRQMSAADVRHQLSPFVVPCDPSCNPATANDEFYAAVHGALPMFAEQFRADAADSWALGMRLRQFVDGGLLEDLDATLAGAIEAQPRSFMRTVQGPSDKSAVNIALLLGPSFVDADAARRCRAYRQRLSSISSVRDEDLHEVRAAVERALLAVLEPCG